MSTIFTPTNQKRLTNVVVVRLKKGGKRFEIACYPNKVLSWRDKVEKDLDEVLQSRVVFINVSKGQSAKTADLKKVFNTENQSDICIEILTKGELQVSEKERTHNLAAMLKEIATTISVICVNPETRRPYPVTMIESAMKELHYSVKPNKNAKQQALDVIKKLQEKEIISIGRAQMKLRIVIQAKDIKKTKDKIKTLASSVVDESFSDEELNLVILCDPGCLKLVEDIIREVTKGRAKLDVISLKDINDDEVVFT